MADRDKESAEDCHVHELMKEELKTSGVFALLVMQLCHCRRDRDSHDDDRNAEHHAKLAQTHVDLDFFPTDESDLECDQKHPG